MIPGIVSAPLLAYAQGLSAVAVPSSVVKSQGTITGAPRTMTTPATTVSVDGGTSPYSHSWATDNPNVSVVSSTAATTTFRATLGPGDSVEAIATDTVTDANGVATTAECSVSFSLADLS